MSFLSLSITEAKSFTTTADQRPYPSFFGSYIWVKSESNLIYLSKIWVKTRPKKRVFATYPVSRQKCVFGLVWFGHDYGLWSKVKLSIWYNLLVCNVSPDPSTLGTVLDCLTALSSFKLTLLENDSDVWQCLWCKTEKTQISGQTQIIWGG